MRVVLARGAFLFHVRHFAVGRNLTIVAGDAAASKRCEPEETNQTHHVGLRSRWWMSNSCTEELPDRFLALDPRNKFVIREIYARLRESRRASLVRRRHVSDASFARTVPR